MRSFSVKHVIIAGILFNSSNSNGPNLHALLHCSEDKRFVPVIYKLISTKEHYSFVLS